jgi:hypothetical protein
MVDYIVCHKKRNSPRLNVRICEEKCPHKNECKEYLAHLNMLLKQKRAPAPSQDFPALMSNP